MTTATWTYSKPTAPQVARRSSAALLRTPILWAVIALFVLSLVLAPNSVSGTGLDSLFPFAAVMALAAVGQTLVIMLKGIDLSVPGMVTVGAIVSTQFAAETGSVLAGMALVLAIALVVGVVNGAIIAYFSVSPLVVTLAMNTILLGSMLAYSGGTPTRAPASVSGFALDKTLGVSNVVWTALIIVLIISLLVSRTSWGARLVAVGSNDVAAHAAGIRVMPTRMSGYVIASLCYAVAGVLLAGYLTTPNSQVGTPYLLPVIAAVVLGGTSLLGGRGKIWGTVLGALFLSQLTQLVLSIGAPSSMQYIIQAVVIFVAVALSTMESEGKLPGWLRLRRNTPPLAVPSVGKVEERKHHVE